MFENSNAQQKLQSSRTGGQSSSRRSLGMVNPILGSGNPDTPPSSSGGQQRLKNALNLGKAVGAKVNDLLRRKDSHLGDVGVTEVNKNVDTVWSTLEELTQETVANRHASMDPLPRLDPPPPSTRKRLPRALKTTQDMMISSDPVVTSPDPSGPSSPGPSVLSPQDQPPPLCREEEPPVAPAGEGGDGRNGGGMEGEGNTSPLDVKREVVEEEGGMENGGMKMEGVVGDGTEERREGEQLQLSVPDLIHKEHLELRAKMAEPRQKGPSPGEDGLANGTALRRVSGDTEELEHPDLLSFE
ncbi:uncharacterized protein C1orf226 [Osmerus eperlanus]|uniref:uncharacterized protein C1orf226 n=1 Tax=Osmerus eperlanus TaxID=29151 RepID=UPI002E0D9D6E